MTVHEIRGGVVEMGVPQILSPVEKFQSVVGYGIDAYEGLERSSDAHVVRPEKIEASVRRLRDQLAEIPEDLALLEPVAVLAAIACYDSWCLRRIRKKIAAVEMDDISGGTYRLEDDGLSPAVCDLVRDQISLRKEAYQSTSTLVSVLGVFAVKKAA